MNKIYKKKFINSVEEYFSKIRFPDEGSTKKLYISKNDDLNDFLKNFKKMKDKMNIQD